MFSVRAFASRILLSQYIFNFFTLSCFIHTHTHTRYVLKSGGEYYFCEEEAQPALSWESPFHVIEGIIVFPVHIDASHVYSELKAEFDRKSEDSALLPSEYLARLHDGFVLAVCDVDPVHGDVLGM